MSAILDVPSKTTTSKLLRLPDELQLHIISFLPRVASIALSWTCREFYNLVADTKSDWRPGCGGRKKNAPSPAALLTMEQWPCFRYSFACMQCSKLRHFSHFITAKVQKRYQKGQLSAEELTMDESRLWRRSQMTRSSNYIGVDADADDASKLFSCEDYDMLERRIHSRPLNHASYRYCIDCGVKRRDFEKGGPILRFPTKMSEDLKVLNIGTGIVCKRCGLFKVCEADSAAALRRTCVECLKYRPRGRLQEVASLPQS